MYNALSRALFRRVSWALILSVSVLSSAVPAQNCAGEALKLVRNAPLYSLGKLGETEYSTVILLGPPAAGKGTLSEELMSTDAFTHVSVGAALRENIKAKTALGMQAESYMTKGDLVPEEIIRKIVADTLDKAPKNKPLIFDGSPRKLEEAKFIVEALKERQRTPVLVMLLEVSDDVVIERAVRRSRGPDDAPDVVKHRLEVYREETLPAANYLRGLGGDGLVFRSLDGSKSVDEVRDSAVRFVNGY